MIIYKITNLINNKVYVGQTMHTLEQRFNRHVACANKGCMGKLYPAMRKYDIQNFKAGVIEECSSLDELNTREIY